MKKLLFITIILQLLLAGCSQTIYHTTEKEKKPEKELSAPLKLMEAKKIIFIAVPNFRDDELITPKNILSQQGAETHIASLKRGDFVGNEGTTLEAEFSIEEVDPADFDVIVFIGGPGMTKELDNPKLQALAKRFYESGKLTTAICIAPALLANAGILKGKKATVFPTGQGYLIEAGAEYSNKKTERDGNLITADGPESAVAFAHEIINAFK